MTKVDIKNIKGEKVKDITLTDSIFKIEVNDDALKKMIRLQLDSRRQGTHKTKSRSEVSGGGRKPWKQKGTGRARAGSNRSPIWRKGGHVFALRNRDYTFKINRKERVLALKSALSDKMANKAILVVDSLNINTLKTKDIKNILSDLKLEGKVLFVTREDCENLFMATRNLGYAYAICADELNVYDIVNADFVVCDEAAVNYIEEVLK